MPPNNTPYPDARESILLKETAIDARLPVGDEGGARVVEVRVEGELRVDREVVAGDEHSRCDERHHGNEALGEHGAETNDRDVTFGHDHFRGRAG